MTMEVNLDGEFSDGELLRGAGLPNLGRNSQPERAQHRGVARRIRPFTFRQFAMRRPRCPSRRNLDGQGATVSASAVCYGAQRFAYRHSSRNAMTTPVSTNGQTQSGLTRIMRPLEISNTPPP